MLNLRESAINFNLLQIVSIIQLFILNEYATRDRRLHNIETHLYGGHHNRSPTAMSDLIKTAPLRI